jgi:hypothetical protein
MSEYILYFVDILWHYTTTTAINVTTSEVNCTGIPLERDRVTYPCGQHLSMKNQMS